MSTCPGHSMSNSLATMLDPTHLASKPLLEVSSSSLTSASSVPMPTVALTPALPLLHDLTQAFSQALGELLLQLMVVLQGHVHSTNSLARESLSSATTAASLSVATFLGLLSAGASSGITAVRGVSAAISHSFPAPFMFSPTASTPVSSSLTIKPFVVAQGYSPIPEKLVTKIQSYQFVDLANLLAKNLKAQEAEPQTYLDRKLLVSSTKGCIQEITKIMTLVEAFTVYA